MKFGSSNGALVVLQGFVGVRPKIEVKPQKSPIEGTDDEVVSTVVYIDAADHPDIGDQSFDQGLLDQMVDAYVRLAGNKQERFAWVEASSLRLSLALAEGLLSGAL